MSQAFDIWSNDSGGLTAQPATKDFVDDSDAPYPWHHHAWRVTADSRRDALAKYRSESKKQL